MSQDDEALRERLRATDPASSLPPADPDRVDRLLEDVMSTTPTESRETGTRGRSPLTWLVAAAAVVLIGVTATYVVLREPGPSPQPTVQDAPTVVELTLPEADTEAAAGRCMMPTPETLGRAEVAFLGRATGIVDGQVRLEPTLFYAGGPAEEVRVAQATESMQDLVGAVRFEGGERYLVAATDGRVMVCGFSGPYDDRLAGLYADAFAG